jgi:hypothetical protein
MKNETETVMIKILATTAIIATACVVDLAYAAVNIATSPELAMTGVGFLLIHTTLAFGLYIIPTPKAV